jgi:hypothetical protein
MIRRPQFSLRWLFVLTALVGLGCLVGPPIVRDVRMVNGRGEGKG